MSPLGNETLWQTDSESRLDKEETEKNKGEEEPDSYSITESFRRKRRMLSTQFKKKKEYTNVGL